MASGLERANSLDEFLETNIAVRRGANILGDEPVFKKGENLVDKLPDVCLSCLFNICSSSIAPTPMRNSIKIINYLYGRQQYLKMSRARTCCGVPNCETIAAVQELLECVELDLWGLRDLLFPQQAFENCDSVPSRTRRVGLDGC